MAKSNNKQGKKEVNKGTKEKTKEEILAAEVEAANAAKKLQEEAAAVKEAKLAEEARLEEEAAKAVKTAEIEAAEAEEAKLAEEARLEEEARLKNEKEAAKPKPALELLEDAMKNYVNAMNPTNYLSDGVGINYQMTLLHSFRLAFSQEDPKVGKKCMDFLNNCFSEDSTGCFKPQYISRYINTWTGTEKSLRSFMNMIDLLTLLADTEKRQENKSKINIEACLSPEVTDISEQMATNIRNYYKFK